MIKNLEEEELKTVRMSKEMYIAFEKYRMKSKFSETTTRLSSTNVLIIIYLVIFSTYSEITQIQKLELGKKKLLESKFEFSKNMELVAIEIPLELWYELDGLCEKTFLRMSELLTIVIFKTLLEQNQLENENE